MDSSCNFIVTKLPDGRYVHRCRTRGCGRLLVLPVEQVAACCRAGKPDARAKERSIPTRSASEGADKPEAQAREPRIAVRSEDDQTRLAAICRSGDCGAWDAAEEGCRRCGCGSSRHEAWLSKLRLGNCPLKRWPDD